MSMRLNDPSSTRANAALWRTALVLTFGLPLALAVVALAGPLRYSPAVAVRMAPKWELSYQTLAQDDWYPTPREGYCDASLVKRRLCVGPVEVRYSYSY
jgi:hypothetical protein